MDLWMSLLLSLSFATMVFTIVLFLLFGINHLRWSKILNEIEKDVEKLYSLRKSKGGET